jgi:hypothetical protein
MSGLEPERKIITSPAKVSALCGSDFGSTTGACNYLAFVLTTIISTK